MYWQISGVTGHIRRNVLERSSGMLILQFNGKSWVRAHEEKNIGFE
jgi:hypothetical protein